MKIGSLKDLMDENESLKAKLDQRDAEQEECSSGVAIFPPLSFPALLLACNPASTRRWAKADKAVG